MRPIVWLSSSLPPTRENVAPPSPEYRTPMPAYESELVFASPVPTQRPWLGSTRSAPIESVGESSVSGCHAPLPTFFQTPPSAAPAYSVEPSSASAVIRPPTCCAPPPEFDQTGSR